MTYLQGLLFGVAYIAPIGMQNLFVINTALTQPRGRAFRVALIVTFFDVTLALACFFGIGQLLTMFHWLKAAILLVGGLIVIYIGLTLLKARDVTVTTATTEPTFSYWRATGTAFAVAWLNPQALIDGTMLLGAFRASLPGAKGNFFIGGVMTASLIWFTSLTGLIIIFRTHLKTSFLLLLNRICGVIIIGYGLKLLVNFWQSYVH
ncbi:LysE/ArgO family amino acid transporter [Loigolactobacillus backii]|uniref:Amino acid transporter n=1 Tax=Loigolactobacillus backii TaxID=375175 RepID=A0A192H2V2_9LACO|nr:LysE family transporter [Loigolactobacillus backii]ANK60278.1 amino acid transporter [Loigolactobacillus backii]ANK62281.1 amino acid transporter [Loigolactobacillus backii]ANK65160.1 amino acid transporter [Loigolactobacillus backii]ANK67719.1 amino acid transporter [Loigolactobacillus backii]ANK70706.1 amino acid transporter [Loigolactobacillus backii]